MPVADCGDFAKKSRQCPGPVCQLHPLQPARGFPARAGPTCRLEHHRGRVNGPKLQQNEASPRRRLCRWVSIEPYIARSTAGVTRCGAKPVPRHPLHPYAPACRAQLHQSGPSLRRALSSVSPASSLSCRACVPSLVPRSLRRPAATGQSLVHCQRAGVAGPELPGLSCRPAILERRGGLRRRVCTRCRWSS